MPRIDLGSYKKWKIGNDIRKILMTDADVQQAVGNKIFPIVAPENTDGDFILYTREAYGKEYAKQGLYEDNCQEEILIVSEHYDNSTDIAEKVDKALSGRHTLDCGATITMTVATSNESFQDNKYVQRIVFKIE